MEVATAAVLLSCLRVGLAPIASGLLGRAAITSGRSVRGSVVERADGFLHDVPVDAGPGLARQRGALVTCPDQNQEQERLIDGRSVPIVLHLPEGTWRCLTCHWSGSSIDHAPAAEHTRTTTHPTIFRPLPPARIRVDGGRGER